MRVATGIVALSIPCVLMGGCANRADLDLSHQLKAFGLSYHNFFAAHGVGPAHLDDLAADEPEFPKVAKRIRDGSLMVIWRGKLLPSAEENAKFCLAWEREVKNHGGWVLRADGQPEKMSPQAFERLPPIAEK